MASGSSEAGEQLPQDGPAARQVDETVCIASWNIQWRTSGSREAAAIRERLLAHEPEIVCITEGYVDFFRGAGHLIEAQPDHGYPLVPGRRKVMLWSRQPWSEVDRIGDPAMPPGRFVAGRTGTSIGSINVIGVCIPWRDAHVRTGRRNRQPWQDHLAYLERLRRCIASRGERTIVIGDFNQRIPRARSPAAVYDALMACLGTCYSIATAGPIGPERQMSIDHLAHTSDLEAGNVHVLSNHGDEGKPLSDHFGVALRLTARD